jgi:catechol 2,3-dioxygenase-like lactoylglutathione lyase family enzyme
MIRDIRHTGIVVDDLNESLEFYTKKLGFEVSIRMEESGPFINKILGFNSLRVTTVKMTIADGQMIELLDFTSHKKANIKKSINNIGPTHLAFSVDDVDAIYLDFKKSGIEFISSPEVSQDGYAKVAFCQAPEGTYIELVQLLKEK